LSHTCFGTAQNGVASLTFFCSKSGYRGTCIKPGKDHWFRNIICDHNSAAGSDLLVMYAMRDRQVCGICEGG